MQHSSLTILMNLALTIACSTRTRMLGNLLYIIQTLRASYYLFHVINISTFGIIAFNLENN